MSLATTIKTGANALNALPKHEAAEDAPGNRHRSAKRHGKARRDGGISRAPLDVPAAAGRGRQPEQHNDGNSLSHANNVAGRLRTIMGKESCPQSAGRPHGSKPNVERRYGTYKRATQALIAEAGGLEEAARHVRVGKTQLHRHTDETLADVSMPIDIAVALSHVTGSTVMAEFFAGVCGGVFIPMPRGDAGGMAVHGAKVGKEVGEFFAKLAEAMADNRLTDAEVRDLLRECDDVLRAAADARSTLQFLLIAATASETRAVPAEAAE